MINEYENTLRRLIIEVIGSEDTSPYKVSDDRIKKWKETRDIEAKHNHNILKEKRLIYFSEFYDLGTIIGKNWELFLPILKERKRFDIFFSEVEGFRNSVAHGRTLTLSQETLLSGITSDLKNQITIYHNKNEMKNDYFIRITSLTDNLGNDLKQVIPPITPVLRVGDEYEIVVEATDPKGREIEFELTEWSSRRDKLRMVQKSNRFNFTILKAYISKRISFMVYARTDNEEYENNDSIHFSLTVLPQKN
jgi:hypothetical protein